MYSGSILSDLELGDVCAVSFESMKFSYD
jgi:hypothetical protein